MHPKERRLGATRRDFLLRSGGAAFALSGVSGLLAGCNNSTSTGSASTGAGGELLGPGGLALARPNRRVSLPRYEDPIASGLQPETGGEFSIYNYPDYIDPSLLKEFGKRYGVSVKVTPYDDINSGITKLASGGVQPDVTEMTPDNLDRVVAGKLIKPLNLDYIPNLSKNVWPQLADPFYDAGSRYSVPYTVYTTGIYWRADRVTEDIPSMSNPWDIFWHSQDYKGRVAILSEVRETIAMALLHRGDTDINTEDPAKVNQAVTDLQQLYGVCNVKVGDLQYENVAEDKAWLNQGWSGDPISGYLFYKRTKQDGAALRYWHAPTGKGPVQNDLWCVCSTTKKPVLAHLFLNFILDNGNAYKNWVDYNAFQPPLNEIQPDVLVSKGLIPETIATAVVTPEDLGPTSLQEMTLTTAGQSLWQDGYSRFLAGA
ncbi:MAG TPA: spermidine/putrescine ABC transporter substrate-binding protein [Gaiellales bacterium]|jgi:spermidine/putrescine transport system substrate-binding protein|nr:spermidine/putrescine ABC transporter substrate-binding protein [Gaiellales bacterium]